MPTIVILNEVKNLIRSFAMLRMTKDFAMLRMTMGFAMLRMTMGFARLKMTSAKKQGEINYASFHYRQKKQRQNNCCS